MKSTAIATSLIALCIAALTGCATNATNESSEPSAQAPAGATSGPASSSSTAMADSPASTATGAQETVKVVRFAFDASTLDEEATRIVQENANYLLANPNAKIRIEGHADERGTREYNLALGERRAKAVAKALMALGISPDRIATRSWGEEKPVATAHNESAWAQNRRDEFMY
jgi:peptidoglycan-associated lipoprotein